METVGELYGIRSEPENPEIELLDTPNEGGIIEDPFDPTSVNITAKQMSLDLIFRRLKYEEIDLNTFFQRKGNLWNNTQQSRWIESILIRLPLPVFYFDGSNDDKWLVVDGLQRLGTFDNFIIKQTLRLQNLEYLSQFNGFRFSDLPRDLQRRIEETEVPTYIINPGTPEQVKFSVFRRINTGGVILNAQEIRHALNQGIPANFVSELAELREFKNATCNAVKSDRMEDRDFVTRFIAFRLIPYYSYKPDLDNFLNNAMSRLKELSQNERGEVKKDFCKAMNLSVRIFGNDAFRKRFQNNEARKPINKALFEAWSVNLSQLTENDGELLVERREMLINSFINALNSDQQFLASITAGTGDFEKVQKRFETIKSLINTTLQ